MNNIKNDIGDNQQGELEITSDMVTSQCKKLPNWKASGRGRVQGLWLKKLRGLHGRIAEQLNNILNKEEELPDWLTFGRTILCLKDHSKGNAVDNFRPISCLPLKWKLMTGVIAEVMYKHLEGILPEEQKGCRKRSRVNKDQLLTNKAILKDCKRRHTNLPMAWIDYHKVYDMVPHSWIGECLEIFGIAVNVRQFLLSSTKKWKTELTSCGQQLGVVNIKRGLTSRVVNFLGNPTNRLTRLYRQSIHLV